MKFGPPSQIAHPSYAARLSPDPTLYLPNTLLCHLHLVLHPSKIINTPKLDTPRSPAYCRSGGRSSSDVRARSTMTNIIDLRNGTLVQDRGVLKARSKPWHYGQMLQGQETRRAKQTTRMRMPRKMRMNGTVSRPQKTSLANGPLCQRLQALLPLRTQVEHRLPVQRSSRNLVVQLLSPPSSMSTSYRNWRSSLKSAKIRLYPPLTWRLSWLLSRA